MGNLKESASKFRIETKNFKDFNVKSLEHIFDESKERHNDINQESHRITNRSFSLILLGTSIITAFFGLSALFHASVYVKFFFCLNIFPVLLFAWAIVTLGSLIFPRHAYGLGSTPSKVAIPSLLVSDKYNQEEMYKILLIRQIEQCQRAIRHNDKLNEKRRTKLKFAMAMMLAAFLIYLMLSILALVSI